MPPFKLTAAAISPKAIHEGKPYNTSMQLLVEHQLKLSRTVHLKRKFLLVRNFLSLVSWCKTHMKQSGLELLSHFDVNQTSIYVFLFGSQWVVRTFSKHQMPPLILPHRPMEDSSDAPFCCSYWKGAFLSSKQFA